MCFWEGQSIGDRQDITYMIDLSGIKEHIPGFTSYEP